MKLQNWFFLFCCLYIVSCKTTRDFTEPSLDLTDLDSSETFLIWDNSIKDNQTSWGVDTSIEYWTYVSKQETCLLGPNACQSKEKTELGEKFTLDQKRKLKESMDYLVWRFLNRDVLNCAETASDQWITIGKQYSNKADLIADFKKNLEMNFLGQAGSSPFNRISFIPLKQHEDKYAKYASTALGTINQNGLSILPDSQRLRIRLSQLMFFARPIEVRAALIAHELLHQLGHEHPKDYDRNRTFYFVDEFADCVVDSNPAKKWQPWIE